MRKVVIIFLFLSFVLPEKSDAQAYHKFLDSNIFWNVGYADMGYICMPFGSQIPLRYRIAGDTLINSTTYTLFKTYDFLIPGQSSANCPPFAIDTIPHDGFTYGKVAMMREDTLLKKVYRYDALQQQEQLLYDFDAQIGDTLFYAGIDFIVDTIYDIVTLDGKTRAYFEYNGNMGGGQGGYYIEGLGGRGGPFYLPFSYFEAGPWLMCISDTNQNQIFIGDMGYCFNFIVAGIEELLSTAVNTHPNPTSGQLSITLEEASTGSLRVLNSLGQVV